MRILITGGAVGRARAVLVEAYVRDIGTADAYRLAREEWPVRAGR